MVVNCWTLFSKTVARDEYDNRAEPEKHRGHQARRGDGLWFLFSIRGRHLGGIGRFARHRIPKFGDDPASHGLGLRVDGRKQIAQSSPQAVHLIEQIEDDRNTLIIHSEVLQVVDEPRSGEVDIGEIALRAILARQQPAGRDPRLQALRIQPRLHDEFARFHRYAPVARRALSAVAGCH
jgi:hypothetical protein